MRLSAKTRSSLAFLPFMLIGGALFLLLTMTWLLVAGIISAVVIGGVVARRVFNTSARSEELQDAGSQLVIDNDDPRNLQR